MFFEGKKYPFPFLVILKSLAMSLKKDNKQKENCYINLYNKWWIHNSFMVFGMRLIFRENNTKNVKFNDKMLRIIIIFLG